MDSWVDRSLNESTFKMDIRQTIYSSSPLRQAEKLRSHNWLMFNVKYTRTQVQQTPSKKHKGPIGLFMRA